MKDRIEIGSIMYGWARDLFPVNRSITGSGVRETLEYFKNIIPDIRIRSVPSGTEAFDWVVPPEWELRAGWIEREDGVRVVDFCNNNLHVVGYSESVDDWLDLDELQNHLYSLPDKPDAIPYVTSYYERRWGFCISHRERQQLTPGRYHAVIDSSLFQGELNYGELVIAGQTNEEVFLSTYICHPSMANNELSGPVVTLALANWILSLPQRRYTYRIIFIPETIGSVVYLSRNIEQLQKAVIAGFNVTCVGDDNCYSYLPSRNGKTLADKVAKHVLGSECHEYKSYNWSCRGSDERQYCAPGVDLPIATIMRSKYGEYPEYHTSLDNLDYISPEGLCGSFSILRKAIATLENNRIPTASIKGEPMLSKYSLYPTLSRAGQRTSNTRLLMDILTYSDGTMDLIDLAEKLNSTFDEVQDAVALLADKGLLNL